VLLLYLTDRSVPLRIFSVLCLCTLYTPQLFTVRVCVRVCFGALDDILAEALPGYLQTQLQSQLLGMMQGLLAKMPAAGAPAASSVTANEFFAVKEANLTELEVDPSPYTAAGRVENVLYLIQPGARVELSAESMADVLHRVDDYVTRNGRLPHDPFYQCFSHNALDRITTMCEAVNEKWGMSAWPRLPAEQYKWGLAYLRIYGDTLQSFLFKPTPVPLMNTEDVELSMNMEDMEHRIDPDNNVNLFLSALIFMTANGFHEAANPVVGLCITTWVEHQMWGSPLKDMAHGKKMRTRLMHAAKVGNANRVKWLLRRGADVDKLDFTGWTALLYASEQGHLEVVRELLAHGADVNKADYRRSTSLLLASARGHFEVVRELLAHGAGVNKTDKADNTGPTSLLLASEYGRLEVVRELLAHGADVHKVDNDGKIALTLASYNGHFEVVRELLASGADVNKVDYDGETSLTLASYNGHLEVVRELLASGADVHKVDNDGETALMRASGRGHLEVVRELLASGADVNQAVWDSSTALMKASADDGHIWGLEVVRELLAHGANVKQADMHGKTALDYTHYEDIHVLLSLQLC
jgi:ankyrin repeat protein